MEIPIELFSMGIGLSIVMLGIALCKNIPMIVLVAGAIMFFIFTFTDEISRGSIPNTLTDSGSTVTVSWIEDPIDFNAEIKIMFLLISSMVMFVGGMMQFGKGESKKESKEA